MSKQYIDFETIKTELKNSPVDFASYDEIVAISRGGLTLAHLIAKLHRKDVGFFIPKKSELVLVNPGSKNVLFVEDLVAYGRTYTLVSNVMSSKYPDISWKYFSFLVDASYSGSIAFENKLEYVMRTSTWIVFPWEDMEKMNEGDRGLFRDRTDSYGK